MAKYGKKIEGYKKCREGKKRKKDLSHMDQWCDQTVTLIGLYLIRVSIKKVHMITAQRIYHTEQYIRPFVFETRGKGMYFLYREKKNVVRGSNFRPST